MAGMSPPSLTAPPTASWEFDMTFANASAAPQLPTLPDETPCVIYQDWWPYIDVADAREVIRVSGTITQARLVESLQNAVWSINRELSTWADTQRQIIPDALTDPRLAGLYRRAVYCYAKAELIERYRDFDLTNAGSKKAEDTDAVAADARRNLRWAISDMLGKSRTTVEML